MSLRQFMASRPLARGLGAMRNSVVYGWGEIARTLGLHEDLYADPRHKPLARPVTAVLIGAGHRGSIYADFAAKYPEEMRLVGVADPNSQRMHKLRRLHELPLQHCFSSWEQVFAQPKMADAVIIATPDQLHTEPCLAALEMGYDVLLEKPIAPTEAECRLILAKAQQVGRIVGVCHVLRYTPYFRELKELLDAKMIGELISVQHLEPIEHVHMSHSYVRGNWRSSKTATPIILAKSCHDTDILQWLVGDSADNVHCFGNLKWFKEANAPAGSTERCTGGCAVEHECPYSALQIYYRDRKRLYVFDLPEDKSKWDGVIMQGLLTSDYGRCVYRMDNDQPDHLTVNILFKQGVTAAFSMEAFVSYEGRRTRIMGSLGDISGDMESFTLTTFKTGKRTSWSMKTDAHGGGDHPMVRDWVQAVGQQDPTLLSSSIEASVESHLMAFAAERSRLNKTIEDVRV
ncbi:Gfo/Idh/MocA family protein [Paucibacter sp. M5-1]|uniref:Gfo/Idh/MocA family protein n=1 Tax=Paucibacter sp. M5-1 TaxID=3015998 RepID=UPI0022B8D08B|nr:Gfo/Idh/MocA family oxidoreductase [Paucibacter sp. M5-1]MCZ7882522.1 Gfo/Idh/MocA family oxidoreductase [Paucibacter sp. M5-1]